MNNDGGEAFPTAHVEYNHETQKFERVDRGGMSLRDYFAAAALTGLISTCNSDGEWTGNGTNTAREAYLMADEMLKAREQK